MKKYIEPVLFLFFLIIVSVTVSSVLYQQSVASTLSQVSLENDSFRKLRCSDTFLEQLVVLERESGLKTSEILTILQAKMSGGFLSLSDSYTAETLLNWKSILLKYNPKDYEKIRQAYGAIFDDLACFPVNLSAGIVYENSWMFERNYGGTRGHEGTDLMPPQNVAGYYPVYSMTAGIVENVGWLEKGGYRIGIRSSSGAYFYYAHLDSYSRQYKVGDVVAAGEILGLMGDTGYGVEGTRGKFDVHLHLGIYIQTERDAEISVNPYWVLKYLDTNLQKASLHL